MLLLLTIIRVQGYHNDSNGTLTNSFIPKDERQEKRFNQKDFDQVFDHYRSDRVRSREPKFISFNTKDDNIDVEIGEMKVLIQNVLQAKY